MRLVATADTHFPFTPEQVPDGDVFIHAGDLMYSGYLPEWYARVESLAALPHKVKILVAGNHDRHMELYPGIARAELRKAGVHVLNLENDYSVKLKNGKTVIGLPFVTNLKGWAFNRDDEWLRDYLTQLEGVEQSVMVTHAPMYGVLDAIRPDATGFRNKEHVGCRAYNYWFNTLDSDKRPSHWVSGHIHESYGRDIKGGTNFYNVAMCDRDYEQTQRPMVIDI